MKEVRDKLQAEIARLQTHDADPLWVERIRARCLAALQTQRQLELTGLASWRRRLEPAVAFGLSALYLAAAIASTLAIFR